MTTLDRAAVSGPRFTMHILFDLDGTLTDSFPGISRCINHALVELGREPATDSTLRGFVGRPLTDIFGAILASPDEALIDRAVEAYRRRFNEVGIFENALFPGIMDVLQACRADGHRMQVVTAKPAVPARRVIAHFGLDEYFEAIHGPDLADRTCDKAALVRAALAHADAAASDAVMVGDRAEDIAAARANGVRSVGVAWGYGARAELASALPDYLADTPTVLTEWIRSVTARTE